MSKERELLERAYYVLGELSYAMLKDSGEYNLAGDIYEFLSTPEPTQDEEPVGQVGKCHTVTWFKKPEPLTYLFLHPAPRKPFVRLSEEKIAELWGEPFSGNTSIVHSFARVIEDALEEKNK